MFISSRTPEGEPNRCPICRTDLKIEPSQPPGDAPCPCCGHLLWFTWEDPGDTQVIELTGKLIDPDSLDLLFDRLTLHERVRIVLDFSEVIYLSSAILGKLINLKKKVGAMRGSLRMTGIHLDLKEVFRICRLDQVFEIEV